jgi:multimeric flavodoxin WrbA
MKVLMLNGSSHINGTTMAALTEVGKALEEDGIEYEIFQIGGGPIADCLGCGQCTESGCIFSDDAVNAFVAKAKEADGYIFGTPVYYAHPSGRIQSFLDRVFYSSGKHFAHKPGASVAVARRGGTATTFDVLNKYFGITQMITVGSTYWNQVHGRNAEDAAKDLEGMQTMRNLGHNMAWVLKCLEAGKEKGLVPPTADRSNQTNFIR